MPSPHRCGWHFRQGGQIGDAQGGEQGFGKGGVVLRGIGWTYIQLSRDPAALGADSDLQVNLSHNLHLQHCCIKVGVTRGKQAQWCGGLTINRPLYRWDGNWIGRDSIQPVCFSAADGFFSASLVLLNNNRDCVRLKLSLIQIHKLAGWLVLLYSQLETCTRKYTLKTMSTPHGLQLKYLISCQSATGQIVYFMFMKVRSSDSVTYTYIHPFLKISLRLVTDLTLPPVVCSR